MRSTQALLGRSGYREYMPAETAIVWIAIWVGLAVLGVLIGGLIVRRLKRWTRGEESAGTLTMQDLREMRARGQITEEEFEAMRKAILARFATDVSVSPRGPDQPGSDRPTASGPQ